MFAQLHHGGVGVCAVLSQSPAAASLLASRGDFEFVPTPLVVGKGLGPRGLSKRAGKGAAAPEPAPPGGDAGQSSPCGLRNTHPPWSALAGKPLVT